MVQQCLKVLHLHTLQWSRHSQFLAVLGLCVLGGGLLRSDQAIAVGQPDYFQPNYLRSSELPTVYKPHSPKAQGLHFYGEAPETNAIGHDYLLFEVQGKQVSGVIFQPQSEYACFQGRVLPDALDLAIADPFDGTAMPFSIAFEYQTVQVAGAIQSQVSLDGFTELAEVSESETEMLAQCQ